jgi:hypothetical protein
MACLGFTPYSYRPCRANKKRSYLEIRPL